MDELVNLLINEYVNANVDITVNETVAQMNDVPVLRLVRPASEPLGLFLRPGHNDHRVLSQLLSEGRSAMTGVIFDPTVLGPQQELRTEVRQRNLWAVLDARLMELATPSG
ncbi:MAG: hypothetical protein K2Z80_20860 [Xanthobacteraceae bacterium]|nr:hypothetical protein [Xanthobacteraceae bacterium]